MPTQATIIKKVANAKLFSDGRIQVDNVRTSYPHFFELFEGTNKDGTKSKAKYGGVFLLPKATHKEAQMLILAERDKLYAEHNKGQKLKPEMVFLRNGDGEGCKEDYAGTWTLNASETKRPAVRGPDKAVWTMAEHNDRIYGGCYGNVQIKPWWQPDKGNGKRINASLLVFQFIRDGEPFGDRIVPDAAADDLDSYEDTGADSGGFGDDDM